MARVYDAVVVAQKTSQRGPIGPLSVSSLGTTDIVDGDLDNFIKTIFVFV